MKPISASRWRGALRSRWLAALPLLLLPLLGGTWISGSEHARDLTPLCCTVSRGPFVHEIHAEGELESEASTEVRCEVRTRDSAWVRILDVVPEGTYVQAGDFLVQLDSSGLEADRSQQEILCRQTEAALIQVRNAYETAQVAKREYLNGEYALQRSLAEQATQMAQENARRAESFYEASCQLADRGYITPKQLEADRFAAESAAAELQRARSRRTILDRYKKVRQLAELESAVAVGKVRVQAAEFNCRRYQDRLSEIEDMIAKCTIRAPVAGEVVLAHLHHNGHSHMIQPGELTMDHRVMVRLPDPSRMQVKALIREDSVALVRPGMPAEIVLKAYPGNPLCGEVTQVSEFPEPTEWLDSSIKRYAATVRIAAPMEGMRPGMSADLALGVDRRDDAMQVATGAVLERGGKTYCIGYDAGQYAAHEVTVGPGNGQTTVILRGLTEGQQVVLQPDAHSDEAGLPPQDDAALAHAE